MNKREITFRLSFFVFVFFMAMANMLAQDAYRLFRPEVQYLYANPSAPSPYTSSVLGIRLGSQTCETTYTSAQVSPFAEFPEDCVQRVPAFVGSQVCHFAQSTQLTINLAGSNMPLIVTIRQGASTGENWLAMNEPELIYGQVETVEVESFLGLTDSVKYIALYRENAAGQLIPLYEEIPIRISRNYGLLSGVFFHWLGLETGSIELLGMSEPPVGLQNPTRENIFQLAIDDVLHLKLKQTETNPPPFQHVHTEDQARIADVWWSADETLLNYAFRANRKQYFEGPNASTDTVYTEEELYFGEIDWEAHRYLDMQPGAVYPDPGVPNSVRVIAVEESVFCDLAGKRLQQPLLNPVDSCYSPWLDALPGPYYYEQLAGPYFSFVGLSGFDVRQLQYAALGNGFSCGDPFDVAVTTNEPQLADFQLYPNPASDFLQLSWDSNDDSFLTLMLYDASGRLLRQYLQVHNGDRIDLPVLPSGMYWIKCSKTGAGSWIERVVVDR